jgi:hypothetical protein
MRFTGRKSIEDEYDVDDIINEYCEQIERMLESIACDTRNQEDEKIVLKNVIQTLVDTLAKV